MADAKPANIMIRATEELRARLAADVNAQAPTVAARLMQIACEHYGIPFTSRRGRPAKSPKSE